MACKICHKKDTTTSLGHSEVLSVPNDPGHTGSYSQYGPSIFPAPGRRSNNMKVWFFNFEKRLEDDPEVFAWPLFSCLGVPPAGESAGHVMNRNQLCVVPPKSSETEQKSPVSLHIIFGFSQARTATQSTPYPVPNEMPLEDQDELSLSPKQLAWPRYLLWRRPQW